MHTKIIKAKIEKMALIDRKAEEALKKSKDASKQNNIDDTVQYYDEHLELLGKYLKVKNELKAIQVDKSVISITDDDLREKFEKILSNKPVFKADKQLRGFAKNMPDIEDLEAKELRSLVDKETDKQSTNESEDARIARAKLVKIKEELNLILHEKNMFMAFLLFSLLVGSALAWSGFYLWYKKATEAVRRPSRRHI